MLLPAVCLAQTDTTALPEEFRSGIENILRMAEQAQRFYDDSLAPRAEGMIYPIPEYPTWELVMPPGKTAPPKLTAGIEGSPPLASNPWFAGYVPDVRQMSKRRLHGR